MILSPQSVTYEPLKGNCKNNQGDIDPPEGLLQMSSS